tara:strand:- start:356 stop:640 length:285 start_codon:yes stop_codon:yes gene_type:complete
MSAESIKELITQDDGFFVQSLITLYNKQTQTEQLYENTAESNGVGFNSFDAEFLSSISKFYLNRGFLSPKQMLYGRKKLLKYAGQLVRLGLELR